VQFLAKAWVMSPAIFVSGASIFKMLVSEKKNPNNCIPDFFPNNITNMPLPLAQLPPCACKHSKKAAAPPEPLPAPVAGPLHMTTTMTITSTLTTMMANEGNGRDNVHKITSQLL
jgi:hypothetical protein